MKKYTAEQIEGEVADMSAEGYPDGLRTNMLRAFAATLRQQGEQAGGVVLEEAVADELPRVSHVQFDSHEICEHFAGEVRKRLLAAPSQPEDAGHE